MRRHSRVLVYIRGYPITIGKILGGCGGLVALLLSGGIMYLHWKATSGSMLA
jgi:hypothetical protein